MIYLITKKLSGGITYQELEGLADPMRKEIALDRKENDSVLMQALLFVGTGHVLICLLRTRLLQRESSFQANTCFGALWVFNENGGFRILDENKKYMRSFQIVVSACAFGGGDNLDQPIGMSKASPQKSSQSGSQGEKGITGGIEGGVAGRAEPSATEYDDVDVHEIGVVVIAGCTQVII
ncbi:unnamed protein product [Brassica napus]|uniref:(rape) hypothetical protein n=1 Tax=Brassica napus TaxID=3708 RepID=A0A816RUU6_BRANA|nr:unnamed protein product [Brassica napus]